MTYAGLHVADLALTMEPAATGPEAGWPVRSEGLVGLFSGSFTRMTALSLAGHPAQPRDLRTSYHKPDRDRLITLRWGMQGDVVEATEIRNGREQPSEMPAAERVGIIDPLTAVLRLRDWLAAGARIGAELRLAVTDGRKRVELVATRNPDVTGTDEAARTAWRCSCCPALASRKATGWSSWPGQPPRLYEVLVSGDGSSRPWRCARTASR